MLIKNKRNRLNNGMLDDKRISTALIASYVILTIQYFILIYFNLLETENASRVQLISKILVGFAFLYALPAVIKRSKVKAVCIYCIGFYIFLLHYMFFPDNIPCLTEIIFPFFFMCMPALVYSMSIQDWNVFRLYMQKASFVVFIFGVILSGLVFVGQVTIGSYSMSLSYYMLLPLIMYLDELFEQPTVKVGLFSLVSLVIILALGSRGAILCMLVFVLLKMLRYLFKITPARITLNLFFFTVVIVTFIYLDSILKLINNLLLNFGIKSRTIALLLMDGVNLSGRENIYSIVSEAITENPLLGIGIAGDRLITGGYAHNLFLEVLTDFGVIIGSILLITLLFMIIKSLIIKDNNKYSMIGIWLCLGFVPLMVSSSYLISMNFWIFIGLMINRSFMKETKIEKIY